MKPCRRICSALPTMRHWTRHPLTKILILLLRIQVWISSVWQIVTMMNRWLSCLLSLKLNQLKICLAMRLWPKIFLRT